MNISQKARRAVAVAAVIAAPIAIIPVASATPRDSNGEHKVTICHVTNSENKPYVVIDVDVAAFDGVGRTDHKGHMSKDGRVDEKFDGTSCGASEPPPPPPQGPTTDPSVPPST